MQTSNLYVVPAKDEKGQPQYLVHKFNSEEEALKKSQLVAGARGWKVAGSPIVATENFCVVPNRT